jgi:endonuclease/exonuclease/phosphatase family metal-dependent hydrolase
VKYLRDKGGYFCPTVGDRYGMATFINKGIQIIEQGEILLARGQYKKGDHDWDHHRRLQWFEVLIEDKKLLIANVHLTHRPEGKQDSERRERQSEMIISFLNIFDCPKILCGDFNLLPDTKSIQMIERAGMRNLIKEYNITSTRTELYKKPLRLADYVFVSPEIKINSFTVLPDVISDHSPLFIDFDIQQK